MIKNNLLTVVLMLISVGIFAQQEKLIEGQIVVKGATSDGIIVLNLVTEKETKTDNDGFFKIAVKPDDLLVFSAVNLDGQRKLIDERDYEKGKIIIEMSAKVEQLREVEVINYSKINAVSLGILSHPAKRYTPAERRLKTATSLDPRANAGMMMGGSVSIDPLLNWISGRTKLLKSELKVERKEFALQKLDDLFDTEFYTQHLKIPEDKIGAFRYYCIEDPEFIETLDSKNKMMSKFVIGMLAIQFNALQAYEN